MAEKMPSFKDGGAYWFVDLTTPDALYILPVLTALTFLITVECNMQEGMEGNPAAGTMKKVSRVLAVLTVPFTMGFPKKALGIPIIPEAAATSGAQSPSSIFPALKQATAARIAPKLLPVEPSKHTKTKTSSDVNQRINRLEKQLEPYGRDIPTLPQEERLALEFLVSSTAPQGRRDPLFYPPAKGKVSTQNKESNIICVDQTYNGLKSKIISVGHVMSVYGEFFPTVVSEPMVWLGMLPLEGDAVKKMHYSGLSAVKKMHYSGLSAVKKTHYGGLSAVKKTHYGGDAETRETRRRIIFEKWRSSEHSRHEEKIEEKKEIRRRYGRRRE
ncbi:hypothetical protein V8G54_032533 [Vigna mungo]|uniref:Uncharacterized protein n=1 Tax=Vigna mungo TaxID=3915 RepID=A0AAQ3RIW8_VIGMU